jgi:hypothetical protein
MLPSTSGTPRRAATRTPCAVAGRPPAGSRARRAWIVEHVARAAVYMAILPLDANVQFMSVMATKMPYIGRG